jgi:hypothetical protein
MDQCRGFAPLGPQFEKHPQQPKLNPMKSTSTTLAALAMSVISAVAGPGPVVDKNPPPSPMDPCAGPINYNSIELLYARTDFDGGNIDDGNGGVLRAEYAPWSNFFLTLGADYMNTDYDVDYVIPGALAPRGALGNGAYSADVDQWTLYGGIGAHFPITPHIDIAGDAGILWVHTSVDYDLPAGVAGDDSSSDSDTGWYARPHFRGKWGCFTAHLGAEYRDVADVNEWAGFAAVYYQIAPKWDLTLGYRHGEDTDTMSGGVRFRF